MDNPEPILGTGPLPQSDSNAELQRRSIKALNSLLENQDALLFRDERIDDYGVDGALELKVGKYVTNFRAQVQMKSTASIESNKDGSMSLSVHAANLNYLLNGASAIYILFDAPKKQFWYVWAQDESRRLGALNPNWKQQENITLKFNQKLTEDELTRIYDRILREGRLQRRIHDSLARATTNEQIILSINSSSLDITNPSQARDVLLANGPAIVGAGYPKHALQLIQLLDSSIRDLPRIQLTAGYAEYMLGKHYNALGHIRQAIAQSAGLSEHDKTFLNTLKNACEFRVGIIDAATYQRRTDERAQSLMGVESLEAQQDVLYHQCLSEHNSDIRASLAQRIRRITDQIANHHEATDAIRLGARLLLLYIEGTVTSLAATREPQLAAVRTILFPSSNSEVLHSHQKAEQMLIEWEVSSQKALKDAHQLGHPILIGEALTIVLNVRIGKLLINKFDALCRNELLEIPETIKLNILRDIEKALNITEINGTIEGRLRLSKLHADFLELIGDLTGAKALAARIKPEAEAMGFNNIAERAKEILEDRTLTVQFEQDVSYLKSTDQDIVFAAYSDTELHRFAGEVLKIIGSPPAKANIMEEYCNSLREVANERCYWCRHLQMLEDLTQTTDPRTAFSTLPNRTCSCERFGYKTEVIMSDAHALIETFKQIYCAKCTVRSPKIR